MPSTRKGSICILVAAGFEEHDVVTMARVWRQRGYPVVLVGLRTGPVRGCYGLSMTTDRTLSEIEAEQPLAVVVPGGTRSALQLNGDPRVHRLLHRTVDHGGYLVALESGIAVLRAAGILNETEKRSADQVLPSRAPDGAVGVDGPLIQARDGQAAQECASVLVSLLETGLAIKERVDGQENLPTC